MNREDTNRKILEQIINQIGKTNKAKIKKIIFSELKIKYEIDKLKAIAEEILGGNSQLIDEHTAGILSKKMADTFDLEIPNINSSSEELEKLRTDYANSLLEIEKLKRQLEEEKFRPKIISKKEINTVALGQVELITLKYIKEFLKQPGNLKEKAIIDKIIREEKRLRMSALDWSEKELIIFLTNLKSVSVAALHRNLFTFRTFMNFVCGKEGIPCRDYIIEENKMSDLLDIGKLLSTTITERDYQTIKNQLTLNVRDKLIFELAWYGLTSNMLSMLKTSDIQIMKNNDNNKEIMLLSCNNTGHSEENTEELTESFVLKIEDDEVVEDIKKCIEAKVHYIYSKDKRKKEMSYRKSTYLLKPIDVGIKSEDYIRNCSITLQKALIANNVVCQGIDINKLTLTNIRRSRIVYLLTQEDKYNTALIAELYGYKNENPLFWLKRIANEKYGK